MIDTLLHILLGAAVAVLTWLAFAASGDDVSAFPCTLVGAATVYFREVVQRQTSHDLPFSKGWLPWKWGSTQKIVETVVPVVVLVAGGLILQSPISSARADDRQCYPVATLRISFQVVFPNARQVTMDGDAARAYLSAYNSFGRPTKFAGDTLFMNILPNGTTMLIPLKNGVGCSRMIVGPKLHKEIMTKVARGLI